MLKYSNLKFNQTRDRLIYTVSLCLQAVKLTAEDEYFLSSFHKHGTLGSKIFDLFNEFLYTNEHVNKKNIEALYGEVYSFCQSNDEYEVALIMDNVFFHSYDTKSASVCTVILHFVTMLDCFYGDGIVEYIDHEAKKVVHTDLYPGSMATTCDLSAYCILRAAKEANARVASSGGFNITDLIDSKSNFTLTEIVLGSNCVESLRSVKDRSEIMKHAMNTGNNGCVIACSGHYRTTASQFSTYQFMTCLWDREDFVGDSQESLTARLLIDFCKPDILKNRSVLLREKGVIIKRRNGQPLFDNVMHICMREEHNISKDLHCIVMDMFLNDRYQVRELVLDIKNTHSSKVNLLFGIDIPCVALLQVVLGINTMRKYDFDELRKEFKTDEQYNDFVKVAKDGIDRLRSTFDMEDLVFEEPASWNEYNKSKNTHKSRNGEVLFTVIETIGNYTRNLPVGQMASENAIKLAKDHCMNLPDGKTFVSEFTRKRDVRAKVVD